MFPFFQYKAIVDHIDPSMLEYPIYGFGDKENEFVVENLT